MKLLVDANLSTRVAEGLRAAGFDAVHVVDLGLVTASDDEIFDRATAEGFAVVTATATSGCCWRCGERRTHRSSICGMWRSVLPRTISGS